MSNSSCHLSLVTCHFLLYDGAMRIVFSAVWLMLLLAFTTPAQPTRKSSPGTSASQATGALKVITGQAGSVVFINNVRHGATSDQGELDLPHVRAGSFPVRVRTVAYEDWNGSVVIVAGASRTLKVAQLREKDQATLLYQNGD